MFMDKLWNKMEQPQESQENNTGSWMAKTKTLQKANQSFLSQIFLWPSVRQNSTPKTKPFSILFTAFSSNPTKKNPFSPIFFKPFIAKWSCDMKHGISAGSMAIAGQLVLEHAWW